jgi:hydroxymethylpyrimidine/phosphomethylpyrimidine kinase
VHVLRADRAVREKSVHGTGCTFSAAIAARLALGDAVLEAVTGAKRYVTRAIEHAPAVGHGHPPGHHFYFLGPDDWDVRDE